MLRTFTLLGVAFGLVGVAHAEQITVRIDGRTPQAVRADIYKAARRVCSNDHTILDPVFENEDCIENTAQAALARAHGLNSGATPSASIR